MHSLYSEQSGVSRTRGDPDSGRCPDPDSDTLRRCELRTLSTKTDGAARKAGNVTRVRHRRKVYIWLLIIGLMGAGAVVVARTVGAIDSYDGI